MAQEVAEGDGRVLGIPDQESLGLGARVLLAVDVGQNGGNLTVAVLVGNHNGGIIDGAGDRAVRVAKGQANGASLVWRKGLALPVGGHGDDGGGGVEWGGRWEVRARSQLDESQVCVCV